MSLINFHKFESVFFQWFRSLSVKITLIQIGIATLLIITTLGLILNNQRQQLYKQQKSINQNYGNTIVTSLQETTAQITSLVNSMTNVTQLYIHRSEELKTLIPAMLDLDNQQNLIIGGGVWPEPGVFDPMKDKNSLFWARNTQGKLTEVSSYNHDSAPAYYEETWYQAIKMLSKGTVFWSKAYRDPYTNENMISASAPIWHNHKFIGLTNVDLDLNNLSVHLHHDISNLPSYVLVTDQAQQVIAATENIKGGKIALKDLTSLSYLIEKFPTLTPIVNVINQTNEKYFSITKHIKLNGSDNTTAHLTQSIIEKHAEKWPSRPYQLANLTIDNDPFLQEKAMVSIFLMPETYWKIIVVTPLSTLRSDAQSLISKLGIFIIIIQLVSLGILFFLLNKIFIKRITKMANALLNNHPEKLEIEAHKRKDELSFLANAFVSRSHQLETALSSLDASNLALEQQLAVHKETQRDLSKYKDQLSALMKSSNNLIFIKDADLNYQLVNEQFCQLIGKEQSQIIGFSDKQIFPTAFATRYREHDQRAIHSTDCISIEESLVTHQGETHFKVTKFAIRDEQDEIIGVGGIALNITHGKEIEEKQQQLIDKLRQELDAKKTDFDVFTHQLKLVEQRNSQLSAQLTEQKFQSNCYQEQIIAIEKLIQDILLLSISEQNSIIALIYKGDSKDNISTNNQIGVSSIYQQISKQDTKPAQLSLIIDNLIKLVEKRLTRKGLILTHNFECEKVLVNSSWSYFFGIYQLLLFIINREYHKGDNAINLSILAGHEHPILRITANTPPLSDEENCEQQKSTTASSFIILNQWIKANLGQALTSPESNQLTIELALINQS